MKKAKNFFSHYSRMWLVLIVFIFSHITSYGQDILKVSGIIADNADGKPLVGVTVTEQGSTRATKTNNAGYFTISVPKGSSLVFSFTGYISQTIAVNDGADINISLSALSQNLSEVVVVSYGTQKKREITGAIANINGKELKDIPVTNVGQKLQGRLAGV
ncbi:MAG: carboxypeptidase-like regulatory domain-containing protein, partial [Terrimonas sp.]|nr:carboxypeptidase-like regulatory domain-containing protein [Terrimonas sp.]